MNHREEREVGGGDLICLDLSPIPHILPLPLFSSLLLLLMMWHRESFLQRSVTFFLKKEYRGIQNVKRTLKIDENVEFGRGFLLSTFSFPFYFFIFFLSVLFFIIQHYVLRFTSYVLKYAKITSKNLRFTPLILSITFLFASWPYLVPKFA